MIRRALIATLIASVAAQARALVPADFEQAQLSNELQYATGFARATDGTNRFFVIQKTGEVRVFENGAPLPDPLIALSPIYLDRESGLIGIALDPDFATNHHIYLFVTVSATEQQ